MVVPLEIRVKIIVYCEKGDSYRTCGKRQDIGVDPTSVSRIYRHYKKTGEILPKKRKTITKFKTGVINRIKELLVEDKHMPSRTIAIRLESENTIDHISKTSVNTVLKKNMKCKPYRSAVKVKFLPGDEEKRMNWAVANKNRRWDNVWYGDECWFKLGGTPNRRHRVTWTTSRDKVPPIEREAHPKMIGVFAAFSYFGKTDIIIIPYDEETGRINQHSIHQIYTEHLIPQMKACTGALDDIWYLHDNDAKCNTPLVRNIFKEEGISNWDPGCYPARSPDMNPIENAWAKVKWRVTAMAPKTVEQLIENVKSAWEITMDEDYRHKLVNGMRKRVRALLAAKGGRTKY
jgi:hypothetical protein